MSKKLLIAYSKLTYSDPVIVENVCALREKGYDISILTLNEEKGSPFEKNFQNAGFPVYCVKYRSKKDFFASVFGVMRLISRIRPGIIHTNLLDANIVCLTAAWIMRVPKRIYTRHHSDQNHLLFPHAVYYDRWSNFVATHIIAISETVKDVLINLENADSKKIQIIHHGFDAQRFEKIAPEKIEKIRAKYSIARRSPTIGVFSRYIEWKGVEFILRAFLQVLHKYPDAQFIFSNAFSTKYRDKVLAPLFAQFPQNAVIEIESEPEVEALYGTFDIFVHAPYNPTSEAFGMVYVESLLAGVPSIFTISGIAKEFVKHKQNAMVVDYKNPVQICSAIDEILRDGGLRQKLKTNGQADAKRLFSLEKMVCSLAGLYG